MLLITRIGTALFSLLALATGARAMWAGLGLESSDILLDNNHRFYAAIWFAVGAGLAYCVPYLSTSTALFRFLMLALMAGAAGRMLGWLHYSPEPRMIVAVVVEFVVPLLLIALQARGVE